MILRRLRFECTQGPAQMIKPILVWNNYGATHALGLNQVLSAAGSSSA
jgi:hypothetical protein